MLLRNLFTVIAVFSVMVAFCQTVEDLNTRSKELLAKERYEKAWPILKQAAILGHPEAQYNLGHAYETGDFIRKSISKSIEWYKLSAEQGWEAAEYKMMLAYASGKGVEKNKDLAFTYAQQCAENGDIACMNHIVGCFREGWATTKDPSQMVEWSKKLAVQENPRNFKESGFITNSRLNLAYWYRDGEHVGGNFFKSYVWFLVFNESKKDLSFFKQEHIIREITKMEKLLDSGQLLQAKVEAELLLGRPLRNVARLHEAEF